MIVRSTIEDLCRFCCSKRQNISEAHFIKWENICKGKPSGEITCQQAMKEIHEPGA